MSCEWGARTGLVTDHVVDTILDRHIQRQITTRPNQGQRQTEIALSLGGR
jgi:hypothetical protein